ncbi:ribosome maturation factor RimM [Betaproteobacteria bacterium]|nr:ribosome maturation factor RimM [Betaproteobacteria bacterium]GHU23594.1 ribosome maturation factor RimM [Betaproteobacteria bacterium]
MIVLGRIAAPFGVKGWVKIQPFGDDPLAWGEMPQWWLSPTDDAPAPLWVAHTLRDCQEHGKGLVASLDGVADRSAAEKLQGWFIAAPRESLPQPASNEYYWGDLIGLAVENEAGEALGLISGLISTGAHDVLQVRSGDNERLIPFVGAYVIDVDLAARRVRVAWQRDW